MHLHHLPHLPHLLHSTRTQFNQQQPHPPHPHLTLPHHRRSDLSMTIPCPRLGNQASILTDTCRSRGGQTLGREQFAYRHHVRATSERDPQTLSLVQP